MVKALLVALTLNFCLMAITRAETISDSPDRHIIILVQFSEAATSEDIQEFARVFRTKPVEILRSRRIYQFKIKNGIDPEAIVREILAIPYVGRAEIDQVYSVEQKR